MAESAHCRACGSPDLRDIGPCAPFAETVQRELGYGPGELSAGRLLRCRQCNLGQRQPCLQGEALIEAYRRTPADAMDYRFEDNCAWTAARDVLARHGQATQPRRVLDVGCHTGRFLAGLPNGWARFGVESAEQPIRAAADTHGVKIIADRIETIAADWDGQFDAVTLFDVVEHLPDPAAGLVRAAKLLRPGGLLIASTADMDAWTWAWAAGRHWYLQSPLHLSVASKPFFESVAGLARLQLLAHTRIAHRRGGPMARLREGLETIHWECRQRGGWYRAPQRLLQALPGLRRLRHRQSVPWSMRLKDHLFVVMEARGAA